MSVILEEFLWSLGILRRPLVVDSVDEGRFDAGVNGSQVTPPVRVDSKEGKKWEVRGLLSSCIQTLDKEGKSRVSFLPLRQSPKLTCSARPEGSRPSYVPTKMLIRIIGSYRRGEWWVGGKGSPTPITTGRVSSPFFKYDYQTSGCVT